MPSSSKGFSLVELLIAMAIMGIGAALAAPLFTSLIESSRLTSSTNNLVEAFALARSEAVRRREAVQVVPLAESWSDGWMVRTVAGETEVARFDAVPPALSFDMPNDVETIEFQPNGMRAFENSAAITVEVCARSGKGRLIVLNAAGSTQVERVESECGTP